MVRNMTRFYGEEILTPRPTPPPQLEDHALSPVSDCLFNIFAATLCIWRAFLYPQPEDVPCRGDRDPLIMVPPWLYTNAKHLLPAQCFLYVIHFLTRHKNYLPSVRGVVDHNFRTLTPPHFCSAAVCVCFVTDFFRNSSPQLVSSGIDYLS